MHFPAGGHWKTKAEAGVHATATATAKINREGIETETGAHAGAYAQAGTTLGTERSHIGISVAAGGAAGAGAKGHAKVDHAKESITLGGCVDGILLIGATACASQELMNPFGKDVRDHYVAGITSGDAGRVAATVA